MDMTLFLKRKKHEVQHFMLLSGKLNPSYLFIRSTSLYRSSRFCFVVANLVDLRSFTILIYFYCVGDAIEWPDQSGVEIRADLLYSIRHQEVGLGFITGIEAHDQLLRTVHDMLQLFCSDEKWGYLNYRSSRCCR